MFYYCYYHINGEMDIYKMAAVAALTHVRVVVTTRCLQNCEYRRS